VGLIAYVGRADIRRQWRSYAGTALLLALAAGLSLFALAGARRTQSSYPRLLRAGNASTLAVINPGYFDPGLNASIAALPQVVQSRTYVSFEVKVLVDGVPDFSQALEATGTIDGRFFDQDRFAPTQGRRPDSAKPDEVAVNELAARRYGYHMGQRLELGTYGVDQPLDAAFVANPTRPKLTTSATIVGIGVFPDEVLQDEGDRTTRMLLTPAFSRAAIEHVTYGVQGLVLAHGDADIAAVQDQVNRDAPPGTIAYRVTSVDVLHALRAVRPLSLALAVFGVLVGLAGLVLVSQALARAIRHQRDVRAGLRSMGARQRAIAAAGMAGPVVAIVSGAALAVVLAVALSPLMPAGPVRKVEAHPGFDLDATVMGVGALAIVLTLLVAIVVVSLLEAPERVAGRAHAWRRPSWIITRATGASMGPAAVAGLRFALEPGGGPSAAPTRSVMVGAAVAVTALVGSVTFGASFTNLVDHPRLYGWSGDAVLSAGTGYGNIPLDGARAILDHDPAVQAWSGTYFGVDQIDGLDTPLLGMDPGAALLPVVLRGRNLEQAKEIVLGAATASTLGKDIDDRVTLSGAGAPHTLRVVGIASFPAIGAVHTAHTALGNGALVEHQLVPGYDADITGQMHGDFGPRAIFVRFRPGTNAAAELAHLKETTAPLDVVGGLDVLPVQRPAEITTSSSVANLPTVLAGTLGLAALTSLALALGAAVRRRRHELAVLMAIGFTGRQLAGTVSWLATTTIAVGLLVGVPVGVVVGRSLWRLFAGTLDVVDTPGVPVLALAAIAGVAIILANAIAAVPGRWARRVGTAGLLRAE
jgi:hypothetical protein